MLLNAKLQAKLTDHVLFKQTGDFPQNPCAGRTIGAGRLMPYTSFVVLGPWMGLLLGGVFIFGFFFVFFLGFLIFFSLLASWLLGFLASWLLGFLASWLLGFLAFRLLGFLASRLLASGLLGFLASWLLGFLASWLLGFSASGLLGFSAFCWFMRLLVAFWLFASFAFPVPLRQVAFFRHHGGGCRPPQPPRYVLDFLQRFN